MSPSMVPPPGSRPRATVDSGGAAGAGATAPGASRAGDPWAGTGEDDVAAGADDPVVEAGNPAPVEDDALTVASRQRDEYLDMVRRVQADFENYKKRMQRQQTDQVERAGENLVAKLLPALDAFDLTRAHLTDTGAASPEVKALLAASVMVADALAKEGLERIDDAGVAFDPTVHDAVEHAPAAGTGAGTETGADGADGVGNGPRDGAGTADGAVSGPVVDGVLRAGYRWKGRVIRPAMVRVRG